MSTWLWFASVSKNDAGLWSFSQIFCVANSESCIGQNLSCTEAHIAASAAGTANWWMLSGMLRYAIRTRPDFTYFCTMFGERRVVPLFAERALKVAGHHEPDCRGRVAEDAAAVGSRS